MKKFLLLFLFLASITYPAEARKVVTFQPLKAPPAYSPYAQAQNYGQALPTENYPKITQLEYSVFHRTYEKQNIYARLNRLEKKLFKRQFTNMPLSSRVDNLLNNVDSGVVAGINTNELSKIERKILGRTYSTDDTDSRISRLEKEMIGAMQNGNILKRFETIKTASKHYNAYPEIAQSQPIMGMGTNPYYTYNQSRNLNPVRGVNGLIQNVLGGIFGNFGPGGGYMTGYTPPIYDPYNPNGYGLIPNTGTGIQDYYMGNHGGHLDNRNLGSQSSVRILD